MALWPFEMNTMPGAAQGLEATDLSWGGLSVSGYKYSLQKANLTLLHPLHLDDKHNLAHLSRNKPTGDGIQQEGVGEGSWFYPVGAPDFWGNNHWAMRPYASIWKESLTWTSK